MGRAYMLGRNLAEVVRGFSVKKLSGSVILTASAPPPNYAGAKLLRHDSEWPYVIFSWLLLMGVVGLMTSPWNPYRLSDESGWIEHEHDTPVWIQGQWLKGEYRVCQMPRFIDSPLSQHHSTLHLICGEAFGQSLQYGEDAWIYHFGGKLTNSELYALNGGSWSEVEHFFHILSVHYWGRINRSDRPVLSWRCQRNRESLTCNALD
jgi:hypothetical protein